MNRQKLIAAALEARKMAYAPYSRFLVGAALLAADGRIFTGCNVENAAYGAGTCAERTALFKAVSEGAREFRAIAIVGGSADIDGPDEEAGNADDAEKTAQSGESSCTELPLTSPCGICRQALYEFGGDDLPVILAQSETKWQEMKLGELMPQGFGPKNLG